MPSGFDAQVQRLADAYRKMQKDMPAKERKEWLARYRGAFKNAKTASDYASFMIAYEDDDPDKLVPQAEKVISKVDKF